MSSFFLFDLLPLEDVIHETIMPMLDYDSRIALNRCFRPSERYNLQFSQKDIIGHELYVVCNLIKNQVIAISQVSVPSYKRRIQRQAKLIVKLLHSIDSERRYSFALKYIPKFLEAVTNKIQALCDPESLELRAASPYFKRKITTLSRNLLPKLQTIVPYPRSNLKPLCILNN